MRPTVVVIGELLYDLFPDGERLGGAPSNFAYHAASLGADVLLVSAVGRDARGRDALERLEQAGVDVRGVVETDYPTGTVPVTVDTGGQPTYEIVENVAWDHIELPPEIGSRAAEADVVCWGTLGQRSCRSRQTHRQLFDFLPDRCLRVCDLNFRQAYHTEAAVVDCLERADVLKLNDDEVDVVRGYVGGSGDDRTFVREILHRFGIGTAVVTMGGDGCRVFADNVDFKQPGEDVAVVNAVGTGDAFTAAFVMSLVGGEDLKTCAERANRAGAFVATQDSGMPDMANR